MLDAPATIPFFEPFWGLLGDFSIDVAYEQNPPWGDAEPRSELIMFSSSISVSLGVGWPPCGQV